MPREQVRLLDSAVWASAFKWYLATPEAADVIGHSWLDASCRCIDRLGETPEGRKLIRELIADRKNGLLSYLYAPEEGGEAEAEERYTKWFAVARKAAAAVVIAVTVGAEAAHAEVSVGMRGEMTAAEEKEAAGLLGKLVAPAVFNFLGAISAGIDLYFNVKEAHDAWDRGDSIFDGW